MRDFNFDHDSNTGLDANTSLANIAGVRPLETPPEIVRLDEVKLDDTMSDDSSLRPFHAGQDDGESNNLPKIAGAVVVGLLIVGGGLYAYEASHATQTPVKTMAMKTTAPVNMAANQPVTPPPAAENNAAPAPAPVVKNVVQTPASQPRAPEQTAAKAPTPGVGIGASNDPAIDAPMSFTADNAPPPQQPGSSSQVAAAAPAVTQSQTMAMQQPITPPDVGNNSQPTASVAQLPRQPVQLQAPIKPAQ